MCASPRSSPDDPPPSAALLRALAAHPELMADLMCSLNIPVPDADALIELMGRASREAVRLVDGVDWAGVTAQFDGHDAFTAAHTGKTVLIVDERQYEQHDGPCLQAMRTNRRTHMTLAQVEALWPHLAAGAASVGVNSFLALPLHAQEGTAVGSLNLYSSGVDTLDTPDEDLLTVLAEYLDRALASYRHHQPAYGAEDLRAALDRRTLIEQAVGVLMASRHLEQDPARDLLSQQADYAQQPAADRARHIIAEQQPPPSLSSGPSGTD
jgi:hypothetical protein